MDLQRLRYFVAVAEELHFSRAAQRLYIDQGALSASIRRLEREFGLQLFERTSRRVELTAAGAAILAEVRAVLAAADRLGATVRTARREPSRHTLTVGLFMGAHAAAELTGPIVNAFRAQHPDIDLRARPLGLDDPWGLGDPTLDVVVCRDGAHPGDLVTPLFEEPKTLILHGGDELARQPRVHVEDIRDRIWVHHENINPSSQPFRDQFTLAREICSRDTVAVGEDSFAVWQQVVDQRLLAMAVGSALRLAGPPGVVPVQVTGLAPSTTTVLERRPDARTAAFAATARNVAESLVDLVPEATISPR